jgi:FecR protein.
MPPWPTPEEEIRSLAEAMFDGTIDANGMHRLDRLIVNSPACRQMYLELINLHGALTTEADFRSDEQAALAAFQDLSEFYERRATIDRHWGGPTIISACTLVCALAFWIITIFYSQPAPLGTVSNLSDNVVTPSREIDLGQIVCQGESFTVDEGIISLQLANTIVDLVGPTVARLENANTISLSSGTVVAKILKEGERFKVVTSDVEVLDLGTEFLVHHDPENGTGVSVREGRVQATLLDRKKNPTKRLELTERRSATFQRATATAMEVDFQPHSFSVVDQSRGAIQRVEGLLRTTTTDFPNLQSGQVPTRDHAIIIPEQQNVVLKHDLQVDGMRGKVTIPAGSMISSYLVHNDPPRDATRPPRGAITFFSPIAAVITGTESLIATDALLGCPQTRFESARYRGMELDLDGDVIQISNDRRTASFRFDADPPNHLDEARIIVVISSPHQ